MPAGEIVDLSKFPHGAEAQLGLEADAMFSISISAGGCLWRTVCITIPDKPAHPDTRSKNTIKWKTQLKYISLKKIFPGVFICILYSIRPTHHQDQNVYYMAKWFNPMPHIVLFYFYNNLCSLEKAIHSATKEVMRSGKDT